MVVMASSVGRRGMAKEIRAGEQTEQGGVVREVKNNKR